MSMFKRLQLDRVIDAKLIVAVMAGVIVAGGLLFVGRVAFGTIPDASGDIQACFNNRSGMLRAVDTEAGDTCHNLETAISWSQGTPSGGVVFYDSTSCPAGWSEYTPARGRTVVGLPDGGTLNGTVGSTFADQEDRAHSHAVDPPLRLTIDSGNHKHPDHNHSVDPPAQGTKFFRSDSVLLAIDPTLTRRKFIINQVDHNHGVDISSFSSGLATFSGTGSPFAGNHSHIFDVPNTISTTAGTSQVMPYLQLLACEKD